MGTIQIQSKQDPNIKADVRGQYTWVATLDNGRSIQQFDQELKETSVMALMDLPVVTLHLLPVTTNVKPILLRLRSDNKPIFKAWLKFWVVDNVFSAETNERVGTHYYDCIELTGVELLRIYIYEDGSIQITDQKEP